MILNLYVCCADSSDYHLRTGSFRFNNELLYNVEVSLVSDDVALEGNETFQLELEMHPELEDNEFLRNMCSITITDKTSEILAVYIWCGRSVLVEPESAGLSHL